MKGEGGDLINSSYLSATLLSIVLVYNYIKYRTTSADAVRMTGHYTCVWIRPGRLQGVAKLTQFHVVTSSID